MDYIIVTAKNGKKVPIYGQNVSTSGTPGHDSKILSHAMELAHSGEYAYIMMQRSWRTATDRQAKSGLIPDLIAVRLDGKVDAWEVKSRTDNVDVLRARLRSGMDSVPVEWQGDFDIMIP
jgi:predicted lipoprotein